MNKKLQVKSILDNSPSGRNEYLLFGLLFMLLKNDNLRIVMYKLRIEMGKGLNSIMRKISKDEINSTDLIFSGLVIYVIN